MGKVNTPPKAGVVEAVGEPAPIAVPDASGIIRPRWWNTVEQQAATAQVDAEVLWRLFGVESSFGRNTVATTSSARGPFQITGRTWKDLALGHPDLQLTDVNDPEQQARSIPWHIRAVSDVLKGALGRKPTPTEIYLGHFAGMGDAPKVLKADPRTPLDQLLQPASIAANPGVFSKVRTAGDLIAWAANKMDDPSYTNPLRPPPKLDLRPFLAAGKDASHVDGMGYDLQVRLANMIGDMPEELRSQLKINSGFRPPARQAELLAEKIGTTMGAGTRAEWEAEVKAKGPVAAGEAWAERLRGAGVTRMVGLPGRSNHQHGNAADLNIAQAGPLQDWVHANAARYGLTFPMGHEPWHIEALGGRKGGNVSLATAVPQQTTTWVEQNALENKRAQDAYSTSVASWEALKHESAVKWAIDGATTPRPDPSYSVSQADLKADPRVTALPLSYQPALLESRSKAEYEAKLAGIVDQMTYERKLDAMGLKGGLLRTAASILDPAGWLAGAAFTPIGAEAVAAYKLGRIGRAFTTGAEAAAGNLLTEVPQATQNPLYEREQLLYTGAGGFLFGTGVGALFKVHPAIQPEVDGIRAASASLKRDVEARLSPQGSTAGAMATPGHVEPVRGDVYDFTSGEFVSKEAQKSAMGRARIDLSGQTKNDANPLVSALGGRLVEDAVGNVDTGVAVARAVSVEATQLRLRNELWAAQEYKAAVADYRERNGIGWNAWRTEESRFRSLISDAIDNEDPTIASAFDPAVQRMAQWSRDFYGSYRELAQNPGRLDGTVRGSVRGMEELPPNAHYVPHIWDFQTFGEYVRRFGDGQMTRLLSDAIHSHIGGDYRQADKVGQGYFKALRTVQAGQEASLSGTLSGANKEGLRAFLRQSTDLADEEINSIVTRLGPTHNTEGNLARTKQRQGINAHFTAQLTDPRTGEIVSVAVKDLLERDALKVSALYNRQMSAQVALARLRIENPKWSPEAGPETPRYLVDGIRGPSDWEKLRQQVFAVGDHLGHDPVQTGKAWERLSFIFDAISGTVHNTDRGKLGSALRTIRDLNFVRVMNQVGFAQVADVGVMMSQVGLKAAFANMPSFRGLIRDLKTGRMSTAEARELEMIAMPGTDWIRGATHLHADDFGNVVQEKGFWGGAEHLAQRGTRITSAISGMAPINAYIQRWATKAAVAKFVTAAEDGAGAALNAKRMRVLGLSPAEQEGILGQIRQHRGTFKDAETGRTVPTLNLDKWDLGARHAFEYAIFTWSRRMIQENDLGQMNVLLGTTVGKLLAQFRMFMIAGYTKNTLHNTHMRDWETVSNVLTSAVLASVPYAAQKYLQSIGRSDQQEFLDKELSTEKLAASAFSRAGWSSLMPMLADVGTYALGFDPLFDTRVTGSPSQGIISNPTFGLFDSAIRATRGAAGAAMGQQRYSQADARTAVSLLPFSNALPMVWMVNQMVHGLSEKR